MTRCAVGEVERGERERPDLAAVAEREQSDDREALLRARREHVDRIADAEPVVTRGLDVHRDLARRRRRTTAAAIDVDEPQRPAVAPADERHAERRRAGAVDRIPVLPDELRVSLDEPARGRDPSTARTSASAESAKRS